jgi:FtsP/CotA-like multicopper oxidase with cupredoxin domain
MNSKLRQTLRTGTPLVLVVALLAASLGQVNLAQAAPGRAPASAPQAATLPAETCTYDGPSNTRTCELWAVAGTVDLTGWPGLPIWGYADTDPSMGGLAQIPGPAIIANQGETIEVTLHNDLAETTALVFPGQAMIPDLAGVAPGGTTTYTFLASNPGTYLYEAGPLPNAQHQVAMGLYGALIVRPAGAPGQAYADPATAFSDEALLVLSEIDPVLNANPASFDMRDYAPRFWLINGKAYPDTDEIASLAGNKVLLRYVNAGIEQHSMGALGVDQEVIAVDGSPLVYSFGVAAATIGSGQTADRIVTVPASAGTAGDSRYALYDTSMLLHNNGAAGFGGMLTFISVTDGTPPTTGPTTSAVALTPNPTDGSADVTLSATISGVANIVAAEYFVGASGIAGTGIALSAADGAFDSATEGVVATIPVADLAALASGDHTLYVHGSDGSWGAFNFAVLHLDKLGPATSSVSLAPNPSAGSVAVMVNATGDDTATGSSNIAAAEYFVDATGADGTGTSMLVNVAAPIASLEGSIDAAFMGALTEGTHTVYAHSMDAFGHWGDHEMATLVVDRTGPATSSVVAQPNPNNGALPYSPTVYAMRVDANVDDTSSNVQRVEGYIDSDPGVGSGFSLTPRDGLFNEMNEDAYVYIPLSTINALSEGTHQVWIRGQDASGNWGAAAVVDLLIDKTIPAISNVSAVPNPTGAAISTDLTANATDTVSAITAAEWFDGTDPGKGNGTAMAVAPDGAAWDLSATIDVSAWVPGDHTLSVRARDAAGNWSAPGTTLLCVVQCNDIFADSFGSGDTSAWTSATGAVSVIPAAAMDGDGFGMAVTMVGNTPGYVVSTTPSQESSYHARFYLNPDGVLTGNNQAYTIFAGQDSGATTIFRVQFRRQNAQGGTYQVRASALAAGAFVNTNWFAVNNNSANPVEIAWTSGPAASLSLYVHGGLQQTLTGLDTSAYLLDTVQLGPSVGLVAAASGTLYFDAFVSRRYTVIGP